MSMGAELWRACIEGAVAGTAVETVLYPIDTLKTRLQAAGTEISISKGLYSGLLANVAGSLPASAVFFGVYQPLDHSLLRALPEQLSPFAHMIAASTAGVVTSLLRVPTEVVKQRVQAHHFPSARVAIRQIYSSQGPKGFYAGFGSFLIRDIPFEAIQFCLFEEMKSSYKNLSHKDLNNFDNCVIGGVAGAITGALTTPLDVVKTRLMTQGTSNRYSGVVSCIQKIVNEEGVATLSKGIVPRVVWLGLGGSVFFGALDMTRKFLTGSKESKPDRCRA